MIDPNKPFDPYLDAFNETIWYAIKLGITSLTFVGLPTITHLLTKEPYGEDSKDYAFYSIFMSFGAGFAAYLLLLCCGKNSIFATPTRVANSPLIKSIMIDFFPLPKIGTTFYASFLSTISTPGKLLYYGIDFNQFVENFLRKKNKVVFSAETTKESEQTTQKVAKDKENKTNDQIENSKEELTPDLVKENKQQAQTVAKDKESKTNDQIENSKEELTPDLVKENEQQAQTVAKDKESKTNGRIENSEEEELTPDLADHSWRTFKAGFFFYVINVIVFLLANLSHSYEGNTKTNINYAFPLTFTAGALSYLLLLSIGKNSFFKTPSREKEDNKPLFNNLIFDCAPLPHIELTIKKKTIFSLDLNSYHPKDDDEEDQQNNSRQAKPRVTTKQEASSKDQQTQRLSLPSIAMSYSREEEENIESYITPVNR